MGEKGGEVGAGGPGVTITVIGRGVEIIVLEVVLVPRCHRSAKYSHERQLHGRRGHPAPGLFSPILP